MPRYLIIRSFDVTEDQMPFIGRRSRVLTEDDFPEITWEHSHVIVDDDGLVRTFCVYEAPTEEIVRMHGAKLGHHRVDGLWEIAGDVTPADFPPV
jgi:ligand-binding SRPBCC domain-containing protein